MRVLTDNPVAVDSPDHLFPWGTKRDNTTDIGFIEEVEKFFQNKRIKTLDIGCSGGQLTVDWNSRGHNAIGIEGSDYSLKNSRANWTQDNVNKILFTCDATKPYKIFDGDDLVKFDLITSWEVVEHIHPDDLDLFFGNIIKHMHDNSFFAASIAPIEDVQGGYTLHQSVFSETKWKKEILPKYFNVHEFPFNNKVRYGDSFHVWCSSK